MTEHDQSPETAEEARRARRQLLIKGLIATVAVVVLVVALMMLEGTPQPEPTPTARTVTATGVTQPQEQSPSLAEAATQALRNSSEAAEMQSVVMAEQQATASEVASAPVVPEESASPLGGQPEASAPRAASPRRRETSGRLVLEQSPPKVAHASQASASVVSPAKPAAPAASAASSVAAPGNFFVQVGVFANPGNAEELRAKLKAAGIPTQVETRVQVGPFNSRQEALAAQARLKSLGLDSGMVVPAKR
ncbi:MAG: sporulation related domain protein [Rhodocyclales bacterium]|nr:sporulation related domain protein [Rhodocyclales bacterium]